MMETMSTTTSSSVEIAFTGEFYLPGQTDPRIAADHIERYRFAAGFARGVRVLDIACGVGYAGPMLLEAGAASYLGVDINPRLITYAQTFYGRPEANYETGNVLTYGAKSPFELITCFETIEHVSEYRAALKNLWSLAAPGATLLISSPNRPITSPRAHRLTDPPANKFHTQEFTVEELLAELQSCGFEASRVFGQRQRRVYRPRFLNRAMNSLTNPNRRASPVVTPVTSKSPRYMVIVAQKPR